MHDSNGLNADLGQEMDEEEGDTLLDLDQRGSQTPQYLEETNLVKKKKKKKTTSKTKQQQQKRCAVFRLKNSLRHVILYCLDSVKNHEIKALVVSTVCTNVDYTVGTAWKKNKPEMSVWP